jgi:hypothetical protein
MLREAALREVSGLDWDLDRLPEIKKELAEHEFVVIPKKNMDAGRSVVACLFWLAILTAGPLIGSGVAVKWYVGAGTGLLCSALAMALTQHFYDWKRGRNK